LRLGPRLIVAGTSSGVGKTTVATGLLAALAGSGHRVASAKVGPDFIDPGYHGVATGRPGRNLDAWMCGADRVAPLAARAGRGADILVIEGVMGLFDGAGSGDEASTAHVARLLDAPVVLVVDASAMSGSVAALVHGYTTFDPSIRVAGVILNRIGSDGHEVLLREALGARRVPVLGCLRRDDALVWRDRHLGLVPVAEHADAIRRQLGPLAAAVAAGCDLDAIVGLACSAPPREVGPPPSAKAAGKCRLAVASGPAFSFTYPDNLELLEQAGAELLPFDPLEEARLPAGIQGLVAGGGFPEVFAAGLAANRPLLADLRNRIGAGLVVWAECGGLLWLARRLDGHPLSGVIEADARMTDRLSLGYRTATMRRQTPLGPAGTRVRGHEFHYSAIDPEGDAIDLSGRSASGRSGRRRAGWASPHLLASYLHLHLASAPELASQLVATASAQPGAPSGDRAPAGINGQVLA
jgi:cobyrinic acid a,c-diamide synthase